MYKRLKRTFFNRPTLKVAEELLGKKLVFYNHSGFITEVESYIGEDDPACHAAVGKTKRTQVMYGHAGKSYVYLIYGMYNCLNFVTEQEGFPSAVLIRGIQVDNQTLLDGPGKLCKHMGINRDHNNLDLINHHHFYVEETGLTPTLKKTPRIGISKGKEKLWRYIINSKLDILT